MHQEFARPTPVNRELYIAFANKCRTNNKEVRDVLSDCMKKYLEEGQKMFI